MPAMRRLSEDEIAGRLASVPGFPDITIEYTKVTLRVTTHDAGGLTASDFKLATRIDA